jgi:hypothetical protein
MPTPLFHPLEFISRAVWYRSSVGGCGRSVQSAMIRVFGAVRKPASSRPTLMGITSSYLLLCTTTSPAVVHGHIPAMPPLIPQNAPSLAMEDHLGIVYVIETAQQFWSGTPRFPHIKHPRFRGTKRFKRTGRYSERYERRAAHA